jgi:hypothetical protein
MAHIGQTKQPGVEAPNATLLRMIRGFQVSQMIYVAAKLGIADLLIDGAKSIDEIASATRTHAPSLHRLLRALASQGIFAEDEQGRFGLTPMAEPLRSDAPDSLRAVTLYTCDPSFQDVWGELLHSVQTGETGFQHLYGMGAWAFRQQHPELNAYFNAYMTSLTTIDCAGIAEDYDFSGIDTIVDVGGGQGALIAAILKTNPTMQGIVFDQPHVVAGAEHLLAAAGVLDRTEIVGGDFFGEIPTGKDCYILKSIIHDWDDDDSIAILKNCRQAIHPDGKVLLFESVIPTGNQPHPGKQSDINMLVAPGGQERTEDEYRLLLEKAGFRLTRIVPLQSGKSLVEGVVI